MLPSALLLATASLSLAAPFSRRDDIKITREGVDVYLGETTTFIPTVKRCMINDDVSCFKFVMTMFESDLKSKRFYLPQLPVLATQLGATNIFKELGVSSGHPNWKSWMARAVFHCHADFLQQFGNITLTNASFAKHPQVFYDDGFMVSQIFPQVKKYTSVSRLDVSQGCFADVPESQKHLIDTSFIVNQGQAIPSIESVTATVLIDDKGDRQLAVQKMMDSIESQLSKGVYLVDDILFNNGNTIKLWWQFMDDPSAPIEEFNPLFFIDWLLHEGAPISSLSVLNQYEKAAELSKISLPSRPGFDEPAKMNLTKYEGLLKMAIKWDAGSGRNSLLSLMRGLFDTNPQSISYYLPIYKDVLKVNIFDPLLVEALVKGASQKYIVQDWKVSSIDAILEFYVKNGLSHAHLQAVRSQVDASSDPKKESMLQVIADLEKRVQT